LFDEPLSNLDAKLRVQMRTEIKALHQRLKTTSVYVTHDQIEAMTMADKIVVMHSGIVEQIGSPLQLYDTPANIFVAGFIGSPAMNLMDAEIKGGKVVLQDGQALAIPEGCKTSEGQNVKFGVRPEHMTIQSNDASPGSSLKATVEVIEPTGADTQLSCRVGQQAMSIVIRDRTHLAPNAPVFLGIDLPRAHLFDAGTQKSLRA
jgi:multiple sugar transport system ATP-binding protein